MNEPVETWTIDPELAHEAARYELAPDEALDEALDDAGLFLAAFAACGLALWLFVRRRGPLRSSRGTIETH